ncbi:TetR/AcrR family transcriptional regulator [Rhodococcus sp. ACT016]|uniref:TetR/AcrR family transcriptional regulator n=1 Tax=Rhodococcus sp. ACT016 TaxID=3134808 RepID=UPI003D28EDCE
MSDKTTMTRQGMRTRRALLRAARRVFSDRGFHQTRVADVTTEAGVSVGTFYRYFTDKNELFKDLIVEVEDEVYGELSSPVGGADQPRARIAETNLLYLEAFQRNADFWKVLGEAALSSPEARRALTDRRRYYHGRTRRAFARWQDEGLIAQDLDIDATASMLGAMTERCAYIWFVFGDAPDLSEAAEDLTTLWLNAIGISDSAASANMDS